MDRFHLQAIKNKCSLILHHQPKIHLIQILIKKYKIKFKQAQITLNAVKMYAILTISQFHHC